MVTCRHTFLGVLSILLSVYSLRGQSLEKLEYDSLIRIYSTQSPTQQLAIISRITYTEIQQGGADIDSLLHIGDSLVSSHKLEAGAAEMLYMRAYRYRTSGDYLKAHKYIMLAVEAIEELDDAHKVKIQVYNEVASIYTLTGFYESAEKYYLKAYDLLKASGSDTTGTHYKLWDRTTFNLGNLYAFQNRKTEANKYYLLAAKAAAAMGDSLRYYAAMDGSLVGVDRYTNITLTPENITHIEHAFSYYDRKGLPASAAMTKMTLGLYYVQKEKWELADSLLHEAYRALRSINNFHESIQTLKGLIAIDTYRQDYESQARHQAMLLNYHDSTAQQQTYWQLAKKEVAFQQQLLQTSLELEEAKSMRKDERLRAAQIIALLLLVIIMAVSRLYWIKGRANTNLKAQNEEILLQSRQIGLQRDELERLNDTKTKVISIITHDFRSPLSNLRSAMSLLQSNSLKLEDMQRFVPAINQQLDQNLLLIESLLSWTYSQLSGKGPKFIPIELHKIGQQVTQQLQSIAEQKEISLSNSIEPEVYSMTDQDMVTFILRNLVSNSLKFTRRRGQVTLHSRIEDDTLMVSVTDTGIGMSPEKTSRLFSWDAKNSTQGTQAEKGNGMGLQLCHQFAIVLGAQLCVASEEGAGTTITMAIPLLDFSNLTPIPGEGN